MEVDKGLHIRDLRPFSIVLEEVSEVTLYLEIKSTIFWPAIIIIWFVVWPGHTAIENEMFLA